MGQVIKIVMYTYDPEVIVIGGSVAKAFNLFAEAMYATLHDFNYPESIKRLKIFQSQHPNIALLGAAALVTHP
jgi:glucokinase